MKRLMRSAAAQAALGLGLAAYLKPTLASIRWRQEGRELVEAVWDQGGGVIVCFWHGRIALSPACWPLRRVRQGRAQEPRALISLSPDGAFVADDRVVCAIRDGRVTAAAHPALVGRVEVRGQGILSAVDLGLDVRPEAVLHLAVDLVETASRLPDPPADADILGAAVPRLVLDRGVRAAGLAPLLVRAALRKLRP